MVQTPTSPIPSTAAPQTQPTSFAKLVNFDDIYSGLEEHGIYLSPEERAKFEKVTLAQLRKFDGGSPVGSDLGASAVSMIYTLLAFLKNLITGGNYTDIESFMAHAGSSVTQTGEQAKLRMLNEATIGIYKGLKAQGGNLAAAAELVSGQAVGHAPSTMTASVYHKIRGTINLPWGTNTNLNTDPVPPQNLPNLASTRSLTRGG